MPTRLTHVQASSSPNVGSAEEVLLPSCSSFHVCSMYAWVASAHVGGTWCVQVREYTRKPEADRSPPVHPVSVSQSKPEPADRLNLA